MSQQLHLLREQQRALWPILWIKNYQHAPTSFRLSGERKRVINGNYLFSGHRNRATEWKRQDDTLSIYCQCSARSDAVFTAGVKCFRICMTPTRQNQLQCFTRSHRIRPFADGWCTGSTSYISALVIASLCAQHGTTSVGHRNRRLEKDKDITNSHPENTSPIGASPQ